MAEQNLDRELIRKYQWAGKIRFTSFLLLFLFLVLMKVSGGYTYLNLALASLIFFEAILNQPYGFFLKRVNIYRLQFYQMVADIIAISWFMYYMGGIEAPVVSIAYYVIILWAGVVAGTWAVFFAVSASVFFLSSIVLLEHYGFIPHISYAGSNLSTPQVLSLLTGQISFLFAFGYFSAHSSKVIRLLERKRQEESLKYTHRLTATGLLLNSVTHDVVNHLAGIRGYTKILLEKIKRNIFANSQEHNAEILKDMEKLESENIELLTRLSRFSLRQKENFQPTDINQVIEEALELVLPLARTQDISIEKNLASQPPLVNADKEQLQEALITMILNSLDAIGKTGAITINTLYSQKENSLQISLSDTAPGLKQEYLQRASEHFLEDELEKKGSNLGFVIIQEIIARHKGKLEVLSFPRDGTTVNIWLPAEKDKDPLTQETPVLEKKG